MRQDAEAHAEEDKKRREVVDLKNQGDSLAHQVEKSLNEHGEKVSGEDRSNIESALNQLREALKGDDRDAIQRGMEQLTQAAHKLAEHMYEGRGSAGQTQAGPAPSEEESAASDEDVIDAEYEVKE